MPGTVLNALSALSCLMLTKTLVGNAVHSYIFASEEIGLEKIGEVFCPVSPSNKWSCRTHIL